MEDACRRREQLGVCVEIEAEKALALVRPAARAERGRVREEPPEVAPAARAVDLVAAQRHGGATQHRPRDTVPVPRRNEWSQCKAQPMKHDADPNPPYHPFP